MTNGYTYHARILRAASFDTLRVCICIAAIAVIALSAACFAQTPDDVAKARDQIWAKEKEIYASRMVGGDYYYNAAADGYLAWVYGAPKPFRKDNLKGSGAKRTTPSKEQITNEFTDFSLQGDTAIIYYVNHRTMLADGTPVDQKFDNIHVWIRDGDDWKITASMSRLKNPGGK